MGNYDYFEAVKADIKEWLSDNEYQFSLLRLLGEDGEDDLYDILFTEDSVTGNASGSYWFSSWKAEEALCHNWDCIVCAFHAFYGDDVKMTPDDFDPEKIDVMIRCNLLDAMIREVINDIRVYLERSAFDHIGAARKMLDEVGEEVAFSEMDENIIQYVRTSAPVHYPASILAYYMAMHLAMYGQEYEI